MRTFSHTSQRCATNSSYSEFMTQTPRPKKPTRTATKQKEEPALSPADTVRRRVKELRTTHGWSARELAERCAAAGAPHLDRDVLANIEAGRRRGITVDELLVLAFVLNAPPIHLLVPPTSGDYAITPTVTVDTSFARAWVRGEIEAPGQDARRFITAMPDDEFEQRRTVVMSASQAAQFVTAGAEGTEVEPGVHRVDPSETGD